MKLKQKTENRKQKLTKSFISYAFRLNSITSNKNIVIYISSLHITLQLQNIW